jgi:ubiquitin carboxyl-terminal hydrolase 5/13
MTEVHEGENAEGSSQYKDGNPGFYDLAAFITHLGSGIAAGHYVCHLRQADDTWVYFNDAKVAQTTEPPIGKGYMYFFRKRCQ